MFIKTIKLRLSSSLCGSFFILLSTCDQIKHQGEEKAKNASSYLLSKIPDDINIFIIQNYFITQNNVSIDRHRFVINRCKFSNSSTLSNVSDYSNRFIIQNHLIAKNNISKEI